jgi:hypothetical protein
MKNTTVTKKPAASKAAQNTTSGRPGETQPGKITVTIDGALAEEIRKEAESTGMGPLSLLRQRIKLGSLLAQNTSEARAFRMDIAEKAFREAGKPVPTIGNDESSPPKACGTALVTRNDAQWIHAFSKKFESPPWIVASVLAGIGAETTTNEKAAAPLRTTANHQIWRCIHRPASKFEVEVPCYLDEEFNWADDQVSQAMGRSLPDWMGTLIMLGVEVVKANHDLEFMIDDRQFKLLADSAELRLRKEMDTTLAEGGQS